MQLLQQATQVTLSLSVSASPGSSPPCSTCGLFRTSGAGCSGGLSGGADLYQQSLLQWGPVRRPGWDIITGVAELSLFVHGFNGARSEDRDGTDHDGANEAFRREAALLQWGPVRRPGWDYRRRASQRPLRHRRRFNGARSEDRDGTAARSADGSLTQRFNGARSEDRDGTTAAQVQHEIRRLAPASMGPGPKTGMGRSLPSGLICVQGPLQWGPVRRPGWDTRPCGRTSPAS